MKLTIGNLSATIETPITKVATAAQSGQGLVVASDIFYGRSNGTNVDGSVTKFNAAGALIPAFGVNGVAKAPVHAAEGCLRADHNSLVFSGLSTSAALDPFGLTWKNQIWEIDRTTGATVRKWNISNASMPTGTWITNKIAYGLAPNKFILLVTPISGVNAAYSMWRIGEVLLADDGTYQFTNWWKYGVNLGVIQGMEFQGGYLWFDASGALYRFALPPGGGPDPNTAALLDAPTTITQLPFTELEGLSYDIAAKLWYYGDAANVMRMGLFNSRLTLEDWVLVSNLPLVPV